MSATREEMPVIQHGEGGRATHVVCGYLTCEDTMFDPRLRVFPPVFVVSPPDGPARDWVRASIEYAVQQTTQVAIDRFEVPPQVSELLLVEVLKLFPALAAIHASPGRKWSVGSLAAQAGVSISLLDERFRDVLGLAPIRYLTGWRMHGQAPSVWRVQRHRAPALAVTDQP